MFLGLLVLGGAGTPVHAHRLSDACLWIVVEDTRLHGRLDIPLQDLAQFLHLDANGDGAVTWGEMKTLFPEVRAALLDRVTLAADGHSLPLEFIEFKVSDLAGDPCLSVAIAFDGLPAGAGLAVGYSLLFDLDPEHRGLLQFKRNGAASTFVFRPDRTSAVFPALNSASPPTGTSVSHPRFHFIAEGVHHIWIGLDHILFLLALLLPAVVRPQHVDPTPGAEFRAVAIDVFKVVTAFTAAHSITLALATLGVVRLPSRLVETAIAASVAVAAANNLVPYFRDRGWCVAFGFGLIHGFGFAGVLSGLELPRNEFVYGLLGFNLGVELGQLAIVGGFLPIAFLLRHSWVYRRLALQAGSVCIVALAALWMVERAVGVELLGH